MVPEMREIRPNHFVACHHILEKGSSEGLSILLRRKVDRAMKWSRDRDLQAEGIDPEEEELKAEPRKHSTRRKSEIPSREELMAEEKQKELQNLERGKSEH